MYHCLQSVSISREHLHRKFLLSTHLPNRSSQTSFHEMSRYTSHRPDPRKSLLLEDTTEEDPMLFRARIARTDKYSKSRGIDSTEAQGNHVGLVEPNIRRDTPYCFFYFYSIDRWVDPARNCNRAHPLEFQFSRSEATPTSSSH